MTPVMGVYQITNTVNGHIYIGSAVDIDRRWRAHKYKLSKNIHHSKHLQNAWNKYGADCFEFSVLCEVNDPTSILDVEQTYLDEYEPEYNVCTKAGNRLGVKQTDEAKRKIGDAQRGELNHMFGKHLSEEHKRKVGESSIGRRGALGYKHTEEARRKISEATKGELNPNFGKHTSEETRQKISEALMGKRHSEETKAKMSAAQFARQEAKRSLEAATMESVAV
jgi:hypothetical protein